MIRCSYLWFQFLLLLLLLDGSPSPDELLLQQGLVPQWGSIDPLVVKIKFLGLIQIVRSWVGREGRPSCGWPGLEVER